MISAIVNIIITLALGALTGWVAGKIMKSEGSLLRNIILGILGGVLGSCLGLGVGRILGFVVAVACSCLLIWLAQKFLKK